MHNPLVIEKKIDLTQASFGWLKLRYSYADKDCIETAAGQYVSQNVDDERHSLYSWVLKTDSVF